MRLLGFGVILASNRSLDNYRYVLSNGGSFLQALHCRKISDEGAIVEGLEVLSHIDHMWGIADTEWIAGDRKTEIRPVQ